MKPQPSYAQAGSVYYICLLRDELLLHQGRQNKQKKKLHKQRGSAFAFSNKDLQKVFADPLNFN